MVFGRYNTEVEALISVPNLAKLEDAQAVEPIDTRTRPSSRDE